MECWCHLDRPRGSDICPHLAHSELSYSSWHHFSPRSITICFAGSIRNALASWTLVLEWSRHNQLGKTVLCKHNTCARSRLTDPQHAALGPIWRVKYPSRFERDALCCDILLPSHGPAKNPFRVRLANVHLDSANQSFSPPSPALHHHFLPPCYRSWSGGWRFQPCPSWWWYAC